MKKSTQQSAVSAAGSLERMRKMMDMVHPGSEPSEQECLEILLNGIPPEGGSVKRVTLERIVRAAFRGGWITSRMPQLRPDYCAAVEIAEECGKITNSID